jgi:hypothetical protein
MRARKFWLFLLGKEDWDFEILEVNKIDYEIINKNLNLGKSVFISDTSKKTEQSLLASQLLRISTEYRRFGEEILCQKNSDALCGEPSSTHQENCKTTRICNTDEIYMASGMD